MSIELTSMVEKLWLDGVEEDRAKQFSQLLSANARMDLRKILCRLDALAFSRSSAFPSSSPFVSKYESTEDLPVDESAHLLLLLVLGIHHSDSLIYLPPDMRRDRLNGWADLTKFGIELVKEAATLGPAGLTQILELQQP